MTRKDAQAIVDNIETVRWFAEGGQLEYLYATSCSSTEDEWRLNDDDRMILSSIDRYRPAKGCVCGRCKMKDCLRKTRRRP